MPPTWLKWQAGWKVTKAVGSDSRLGFSSQIWSLAVFLQVIRSDLGSWHHQNICIGCYGNLSVTSQSSQWADSFFQCTDCCSLQCRPYPSACGSVASARSLCCTPVILDLPSLLCLNIWYKQPQYLDWDASVGIWFESHFKPTPNAVISKNHISRGFYAVQTSRNQSGYSLDMQIHKVGLIVWTHAKCIYSSTVLLYSTFFSKYCTFYSLHLFDNISYRWQIVCCTWAKVFSNWKINWLSDPIIGQADDHYTHSIQYILYVRIYFWCLSTFNIRYITNMGDFPFP